MFFKRFIRNIYIKLIDFFDSKNSFKNVTIMKNVTVDEYSDIGEYTFVGKNTDITKSVIGRYCSIGTDVIIGPGEHDLTSISTSSWFYDGDVYDILTKAPLVIGSDVWIGTKSIILRGLSIGNGAVIAAGSVVTKDVPPYAIVGGVPARIIKYRFDDLKIKKIQDSQWWNYEISEAKDIHNSLLEGE